MPGKKPEDTPEDLQDLARRYVDLWQDQMTALAADPEFAESLQKVMSSLGAAAGGLPALWSAWPAAMTTLMAAAQPEGDGTQPAGDSEGQKSHGAPQGELAKDGGGVGPSGAAPRTAAPAAASHGGGTDLGLLEERLAALEQRVRSLEGALDGGTGRAGGGAKRKAKRS